mgnify:CR=1 FL=1
MILAVAAFALASVTFHPNTALPASTVYDKCGGPNISPELHWSGAPPGTRGFALIVFDRDATGGWYHWVVYNIPAPTNRLNPGVRLPLSEAGANSFNRLGYGGPCPPPGNVHHYVFTLYALNVSRTGRSGMTGPEVEAAIRKHVLAHSTLTGLYQR